MSKIHCLARLGIGGVWIYHGLIPKLIYRDWSEMTLLHDLGVDIQFVPSYLQTAAFLEIGFGVLVIAAWRSRWPLWATIGAMVGGFVSVAQHSPAILHAAFNPVTLNGLVILLAIVGLLARPQANIS